MFLLKDETVSFNKIYPEFIPYVTVLGTLYYQRFGKPMIITSANDGLHMSLSRHYAGKAVDIRTKDQKPEDILLFVEEAKKYLDRALDLVWEDKGLANEHLHAEYDPK